MINLEGYEFKDEVFDTESTRFFYGRRLRDNLPVIAKSWINTHATKYELQQFKNQYKMAKALDLPGIVKIIALEEIGHSSVIIMEDTQGVYLRTYLKNRIIDLPFFLTIAINLTTILGQIHQRKIIHCNLKPSHILLYPETGEVKIGGLVLACPVDSRVDEEQPSVFTKQDLPYISPEQTGRVNKKISYQSDLYSLGIIFYEMLSGKLPFKHLDLSDVLNAHLTQKPIPLIEKTDIPQPISDIIATLLEKMVEDRYQSAYGLKQDLLRLKTAFDTAEDLSKFKQSGKRLTNQLHISDTFFGRKTELEKLNQEYHRCLNDSNRVVIIEGAPGIGKNRLVKEFRRSLVQTNAFFKSGFVDTINQSTPYGALIQIIQHTIDQALTRPGEVLAKLKVEILESFGSELYKIFPALPRLKLIVGDLSPEINDSNKMILTLQDSLEQLIRIFAKRDHPLIIHIDNFTELDVKAKDVLLSVITTQESNAFMFIGTYTPDSFAGSEMGRSNLDQLFQVAKVNRAVLRLNPLNQVDTALWLADCLFRTAKDCENLSKALIQKTAGNLYTMISFLHLLDQEGFLWFNYESLQWDWDIDLVKSRNAPDNITEILSRNLSQLPESTYQLLVKASFIGVEFRADVISEIFNQTTSQIAERISPAIEAGLISITSQGLGQEEMVRYHFTHPRIQQAVYRSLQEADRQKTHLMIGRVMMNMFEANQLDIDRGYIIEHLNEGSDFIEQIEEKVKLAQINLDIFTLAWTIRSSHSTATQWAEKAYNLLPTSCWKSHPELMLDATLASCKALDSQDKLDMVEQRFNTALGHVSNRKDLSIIYRAQVRLYWSQKKKDELERALYKVLALMDVYIPDRKEVLEQKTITEYRRVKRLLRSIDLNDTLALKAKRLDEESAEYLSYLSIIAIDQLVTLGKRTEAFYLFLKSFSITLADGYCEATPVLFIIYAITQVISGKYGSARETGLFAIRLAEKENGSIQSLVYMRFAMHVSHWTDSLEISQTYIDRTNKIEKSTLNDPRSMVFLLGDQYRLNLTQGKNLNEIQKSMDEWLFASPGIEPIFFVDTGNKGVVRLIELLTGPDVSSSYLDELLDSNKTISGQFPVFPPMKAIQYHLDLIVFYLFGDRRQKLIFAEKYGLIEPFQVTSIHQIPTVFLIALIYLDAMDTANEDEKAEYLEKIERCVSQMKVWNEINPSSTRHRLIVLEAELCRINKDYLAAMRLYDSAILEVRKSGFIYDEAIIDEICAKFFMGVELGRKSALYLNEAMYLYNLWGATAKVRKLSAEYQGLINRYESIPNQISTIPNAETPERTDIKTILLASRALSSEIQMESVIVTLVKLILRDAGAHKAVILLKKQDRFTIEAVGSQEDNNVNFMNGVPLENSAIVPESVIRYVDRTEETVLMHELSKDHRFTQDTYLRRKSVKTILCMPIKRKNSFLAVLYLENNLNTYAFSEHRQEILRILCAQAAISIENATMVNSLMEEIRERKRIEADLRASEQKYRLVTDNAEDVIWTFGEDFHASFVSPSIEKLVGYTPAEIKAMDITQILTPESLKSRNATLHKASETIEPGEDIIFTTNVQFIHKNGELIWVENIEKVFTDNQKKYRGAIITSRDISERKLNEYRLEKYRNRLEEQVEERTEALLTSNRALSATELKMRSLLESSPGLIVNIDHDYRVQYLNSTPTFDHLNITVGQNLFDHSTLTNEEEFKSVIDHVFETGENMVHEAQSISKEGANIWIEARFAAIKHSQEIKEIIFFINDITPRKRAEVNLAIAQKELVEKAHQAGMADIAAGVLHNVGNILNSVKTSTQIMNNSINDPILNKFKKANRLLTVNPNQLEGAVSTNNQSEDLARYYLNLEGAFEAENLLLKENINRLESKVEAIANVITAQQGYAGISRFMEPFNLNEVIEDALTLQADSMAKYDISISKTFEKIPRILINKTKLVHILINLFNNARESMRMSENKPRLLSINTRRAGQHTFIEIGDSGIGISPENLKKIFTHGFTTKRGGHGFGLHSCALYMEEMNGKIWAESNGIEKGATFFLKFSGDEKESKVNYTSAGE